MFLFKCCQEYQSGIGYEISRTTGKDFRGSVKDLSQNELTSDRTSIRKIKKSQYEEVFSDLKKNNKKFIDHQFPAQEYSLGEIQGIQHCQWIRISDLIASPILIGKKIEPSQVIQGSLGDCYFLSALAALAQNESIIQTMFEGQEYTPTGIYKVLMRINGQLQEIVVDDFIPVNEQGQPFFCQPYRNQFWMLILEKAWAKIHRSYSNIIMGTPTAVFRVLTLAPADLFVVKDKSQDRQKIWRWIMEYTTAGYSMVCNAREDIEESTWVIPNHSYSLIGAAMLEDSESEYQKVVKMRDPWNKNPFDINKSEQSRAFWSKILVSHDRKELERKPPGGDAGIFYLPYLQFCRYFSQVHYSLQVSKPSYNSEQLFVNKKNGSLYEVRILKQGRYSFELHQSEIDVSFPQEEDEEEGPCRSTMLLIKQQHDGPRFVNGILRYSEEDALLTQNLDPGAYILFVKVDPTRSSQQIPIKTVVSVYSSCFTSLQLVQRTKYPDLLRRVFLRQARGNKKNEYNNGLMWLSWKLLLQQGGYAYVAVGVDSKSNKKFVIDFNQQQFNGMHFKLKKPHKGKGSQKLQVWPGQEQIILARVDNALIKSMKFPPNLGIKMELIDRTSQ